MSPAAASSAATALMTPTHLSVFINYRRQDTAAAAEHLHVSLGQKLGMERIFRDEATIELGEEFPEVIEQAIRSASVVLALIGPSWLTVKGKSGKRRLDEPLDYVRRELETAMKHRVKVIPVLVDGATMPTNDELPESLRHLELKNALTIPWQEGIDKLQTRVAAIETQRREREASRQAESARLDLTRGRSIEAGTWRAETAANSINTVIRAMEVSLVAQGQSVKLDPADLNASLGRFSDPRWEGAFMFPDMVYVIDIEGVKARKGTKRYVARSFALSSLDDLPEQLRLGRPVLAGVQVFDSWFHEPIAKTGFVDVSGSGMVGAVVGVVLAWDPASEQMKILTPWPTWGDRGMGTLTRAAAKQSIAVGQLRSIEATLKPEPLSKPRKHAPRRRQSR
jgi:hypothetical protein